MKQNLLKPWARFLIVQCVVGVCFVILISVSISPLYSITTSSLLGLILSRMVHREFWWSIIHVLFLPAVVLALSLQLPSYFYLIAFILSWVLFGQIARSRVPLFLTEQAALEVLAARLQPNAKLLDIGAGTGRVLHYLARVRPDLQLYGVELAWLPWLYGKFTLSKQVSWQKVDYHKINFAEFDYVYAYLSPAAMPDVWKKARQEMAIGSQLLSNSFGIEECAPTEEIALNDWKNGKLLIWQM